MKACVNCGNDDAAYDSKGRTVDDGVPVEYCLDCLEELYPDPTTVVLAEVPC